jgi:uncharacterized membrane protein
MAKKTSLDKEIKDVEKYEYLLVEYIKHISNEITYLLLIMASLFLFVLIDISPQLLHTNTELLRIIFVVLIVGGFALFGISSVTKRKIERKFEDIFA